MRTWALLLILLSSLARAQTVNMDDPNLREGATSLQGSFCPTCYAKSAASGSAASLSALGETERAAIRQMLKEDSLNAGRPPRLPKASVETKSQDSESKSLNRMVFVIEHPEKFDARAAEVMAYQIQKAKFENAAVVDVYLLREKDRLDQDFASSQVRHALRDALRPYLESARSRLKSTAAAQLKNLSTDSADEVNVVEVPNSSRMSTVSDDEIWAPVDTATDRIKINGSSVGLNLYERTSKESHTSVSIGKSRSSKARLELNLGRNLNAHSAIGFSSSLSKGDKKATVFYVTEFK